MPKAPVDAAPSNQWLALEPENVVAAEEAAADEAIAEPAPKKKAAAKTAAAKQQKAGDSGG